MKFANEMNRKKYELVMDDSIVVDGITLYRIKALKDFNDVRTGDLGGYVSGEHNLSHEGNCWIYGNAKVFNRVRVYGDAKIYDNAKVFDYTKVYGNAQVYSNAWVCDNARIFGNAQVYGDARIYGDAKVFETARIFNDAKVYGDAMVYGDAEVYGNARVYGNAGVYGNAQVYGDVKVFDCVILSNYANISSNNEYLYIKGLGSENRDTTVFKLSDGGLFVICGCFEGTLDNFESKVKDAYGNNKYGKEYNMLIDMCKLHFDLV